MEAANDWSRVVVALGVNFLLFAATYAEPASAGSGGAPSTATLFFKNGFEGTTHIARNNAQHDNLEGADDPTTPSDWEKNMEVSPFGPASINYEQGDVSQRRAEIIPDPLDPTGTNHVLRFRINEKHIKLKSGQEKARIQYEVFNKSTPPPGGYIREYYQKCRLYFSPSFTVLEDTPTDDIGWIVMQEFWNDSNYEIKDRKLARQARTGVEIIKRNGKLRFGAKGRDPVMEVPRPSNNSWEVYDEEFAIPFGRWMTQEIYVKEGGSAGTSNPGRFYMSITVDGKKHIIVDKIGMTTAEEPGYVPDGQTSWSPMKFYTDGRVPEWFKAKNVSMDVCWDDLEIWLDRQPDEANPGVQKP